MASRTDSFRSPYAAAPRVAWGRMAFTFVLTLIALIVFGAAFAIGYARMNEGRVLPGVTVGGVDIAGLSRSAAEARLRQSLPSLSAGALNVDIDSMLDGALSVGRGDNFVEQLREQIAILLSGVSVEPRMTWDNDALAARV